MSDDNKLLLSFTPLCNRHIDAVVNIDSQGIPPFWGKAEFRRSFKNGNNHAYVLEIGPYYDVIGFVALEALPTHTNILNIGVTKTERRKGYGRSILHGVRARFPNRELRATIYESCLDIQLFLYKTGFLCHAIAKTPENDLYLFNSPQDSIG